MAHLLGAESLHLEYPTRVVFDSVTLGVSEGDRIGVVGRNGDGKSTLLSLLAGRLEPDAGRVTRRRDVTVGMLDQRDDLPDALTVGRAIVGDREEHVWAGDPRVRDVLAGLVADIPWDAAIGELSGGQRRRVALAALLVHDHDLLFLDEPTNHLDIEGVAWLASHLKQRWASGSGALVVVTHDRWFLDEVSTSTWEVHDRIVEPFEGGYAAYVLQRVERDRMAAVAETKRQNLMRKELAWLRRGAPARTSKPKFRMDAAAALIADEPAPRDSVELTKLATARLGKDVVDLLDVTVEFPPKTVLRDVEWRIAPGERTGVLGINGAGKSTLLGLVAGTVEPTAGRVKRGKTVKIATLTQQLDELGSGPVGYTGMTLASAIGIPLAAAEPRIRAASFGGIGAHAFVLAAAREVTIPIEFLFPLDDAEITRASQLELFDAFASTEKVLLGFPGSHFRVPAERLDTRLFPRTFG